MTPHRQNILVRRRLIHLLSAMWLSTACGCSAIAYPFAIFQDRSIPAQYTLQDRATAIIVDDPFDQFDDPAALDRIAELTAFELKQHKVVSSMISHADVRRLAIDQGDQFASMSLHRIGETLGAEQVIHIKIRRFAVSKNPGLYRPQVQAWVRIWDVVKKKRLFPTTDSLASKEGYLAEFEDDYRVDEGRGVSARQVVVNRFAEHFSEQTAKLFYKHESAPPGALVDEVRKTQ